MKIINEEGYTFDDYLLVPSYSEIESRKDVALNTYLAKNTKLDIPIISANMDTITESSMMIKISELGGMGILHRFLSTEKMIEEVKKFSEKSNTTLAFSVGVCGDAIERIHAIYNLRLDNHVVVCIDVAHGDCKKVIELVKEIKEKYNYEVIAGNVATAEATRRLCEAGASSIKCGIGPGSLCTTRLITGCGVPQLTAIMECSQAADEYEVPIIADGGITKSGDIVKALAAGASSVMIGSLFAGTDETPGEIIYKNFDPLIAAWDRDRLCGPRMKKYRGMASEDAQTGWKGNYHATPEGESHFIPCRGSVVKVVENLLGGIRSGFTYCGAKNIQELWNKATFRRVSGNTLIENKPHGKN